MKISTTKPQLSLRTKPLQKQESTAPTDRMDLSFIKRVTADPFPKGKKAALAIPAVGGLAVGAAAGVIGEGLGGGAALPGIGLLGVAGAALGSKLDGLSEGESKKWTICLAATGGLLGAAGVVAGAVGGWPGAVAGGISLGGAGFALGHLLSHLE